jgi:hypothetical protein
MDTSQNALSACTHNDRSRKIPKAGSKLLKPQISQHHPSRICFITLGWHVSRDFNLFSLTMKVWKNSNVSSNKCVCKQLWLKPNQLQVTTITPKSNAVNEQAHNFDNDIFRSFDLENNNENLKENKDNLYDYFLQSTA